MPFLSCTCLSNNSKLCLPSFVSHSSCRALLLLCFLLNIGTLYCGISRWAYFDKKHPFATSVKKGGWAYFQGVDLFSGNDSTVPKIFNTLSEYLKYTCACLQGQHSHYRAVSALWKALLQNIILFYPYSMIILITFKRSLLCTTKDGFCKLFTFMCKLVYNGLSCFSLK